MNEETPHIKVKHVHVNEVESLKDFVQKNREPILFKGIDIGPALNKWSNEYLCKVIGNVPVKVHVCDEEKLDFLRKNFSYKTIPFNEFMSKSSDDSENKKYYLRSLGNDNRKDVADIKIQYPSLKDDLIFPSFFSNEEFFSSVFRISSKGTQLWTHYDVMDNVLIHVKGLKKVVLFPPNDALNLYLQGDKSEIIDIDNIDIECYEKFQHAARYECYLKPGDILFIPALWFHNVKALEFSISVNVFWKNLKNDLYDSKDVYGNKDLINAQRAYQGVDKALKKLNELPSVYADFYKRMLITQIEKSIKS